MRGQVIIELSFAEDCTAVELKKEYTGYFDAEKYALVSVLSEKELVEKYGALLDGYRPFVVITPEMADVICEYWRNEWKHEKRMLRGSLFPVGDDFDEHHPECAGPDCLEQLLSEELSKNMQAAIGRLTPIQQRRLFKWVYLGMTFQGIAENEGASTVSVFESINLAIKKIKKISFGYLKNDLSLSVQVRGLVPNPDRDASPKQNKERFFNNEHL